MGLDQLINYRLYLIVICLPPTIPNPRTLGRFIVFSIVPENPSSSHTMDQ